MREVGEKTRATLDLRGIEEWFRARHWVPFEFQRAVWSAIAQGESGLLHSATGTGKTLAVWFGALLAGRVAGPLSLLWVTPMRALAADTARALESSAPGFRVALWTGDVPAARRRRSVDKTLRGEAEQALREGTTRTIAAVEIRLGRAGRLGSVEESFIARLRPGDVFRFAGKRLELVRFRDLRADVRLARRGAGVVPQWMGGKMPLSSELGVGVRQEVGAASKRIFRANFPDPGTASSCSGIMICVPARRRPRGASRSPPHPSG